MTLTRILVVATCFLLGQRVEAESPTPIQLPTPTVEIPAGTRFLAENAETFGWVWGVSAGGAVVLIVGGILLRSWARSRQTNDPLRLAMADPWMRARFEAMTEKERADFLESIKQ